jgi:hypothetical protein
MAERHSPLRSTGLADRCCRADRVVGTPVAAPCFGIFGETRAREKEHPMRRAACAVALLWMSCSAASANQPVKVDRVTYSSWDYKYTTPAGAVIEGTCTWNDSTGSYAGGNAKGTFSNISAAAQTDGSAAVSGAWMAGAVTGRFKFVVTADKTSFDGTYTIDGRSDGPWPWTGKQTFGFEKYSTTTSAGYYCCKCYFLKTTGVYDWCWCTCYPSHGKRCYFCLQDGTFWGCCNPFGSWWRCGFNSNWYPTDNPWCPCPGCYWPCGCCPPPPTDNNDIPADAPAIPAPPNADSPAFHH